MLQDLLQFHQMSTLNAKKEFSSNGRIEEDKVLEGIDWTFTNSKCLNDVLETTVTSLPNTVSDHSPILLDTKAIRVLFFFFFKKNKN